MDSTTYNFGPIVVPAANFAGLLDRPSDVNIRTACWGYGHNAPSKGFLFQLGGVIYLKLPYQGTKRIF